jgi:hypothetical protein
MVDKPPITVYSVHPSNLLTKPANVVAECIVLHTTAGGSTIDGLAAWFGGLNVQQGLRGSTHFGVDRMGAIGMFVDPASTSAMPIANGQESGATAKIVAENPGISANAYTVSIEHLDNAVPGSVTEIQLARSAWLCAWIWETYIQPHAWKTGATLDLDHLLQHKDFAPASRPFCASWPSERMQAHLAKMTALINPPKPKPEPEPEPIPPTPEPVTDWETKYAQLDREVEQWLADDTIGAEMRRQRLAELRMS